MACSYAAGEVSASGSRSVLSFQTMPVCWHGNDVHLKICRNNAITVLGIAIIEHIRMYVYITAIACAVIKTMGSDFLGAVGVNTLDSTYLYAFTHVL